MRPTICRHVNGKFRQPEFGIDTMKIKRSFAPIYKKEKFVPGRYTIKKTEPPLYAPYDGREDTAGSSNSAIKRALLLEKHMLNEHLKVHHDAIADLATRPGGAYGKASLQGSKSINAASKTLKEGDFVVLFRYVA